MVVEALRDAGWKVDAVFGSDGSMCAKYRELGCAIHVLSHGQWLRGGNAWRRARRLGRDLLAACRFVRLLRGRKPDLVYVNNLTGLAPILAARILGIPAVWHIRELFADMDGEMHAPLGGKMLARWAVLKLASRVVVISRAVAENVLGGVTSEKVSVIPNAVDDRFFEESRSAEVCRTMLELPLGVPLVGVPGTLRPVKGHEFFLAAARRVAEAIPECHFAITGDGESGYRKHLEALAAEANLADRTHFLGPVADMPAFYRACDVICVPSRSESFGRAVIEAFAVGTPVIATAVGGMRETIEDGETGWLVSYGDETRVSSVIVHLLASPDIAQQAARAAKEAANVKYRNQVYRDAICSVVRAEPPAVCTSPDA